MSVQAQAHVPSAEAAQSMQVFVTFEFKDVLVIAREWWAAL